MSHSIPIIEARSRLTTLPEELERDPRIGAVAITRRGKPVLAVMSWDLYESLTETMEILSDKKLMASFRRSVRQLQRGKLIPWDTVKKKLGL